MLLLTINKFESSANSFILEWFTELGISFMYKRKSYGPKTIPWGIPQVVVLIVESLLLTTVNCERPTKYDLSHEIDGPRKP